MAPALGVSLQRVDIATADDLDAAFRDMRRTRPEALYVMATSLVWAQRQRIANLAIANRLPSACSLVEYAEAGGLIGYAPDIRDMWRRGAGYVDKILRGAKVGDLPVDRAAQLQLVINLKTAKAIGLTIRRQCWLGRIGDRVTPPIWLDAAGRRRPTRACWTCGREVVPMRLQSERRPGPGRGRIGAA